MHDLNEFVNKKNIINNGYFNCTGSAKSTSEKNTLCYAITLEYLKIADNNPFISCILTTKELANEINNKSVAIDNEPDILFGIINNKLIKNGEMVPSIEFEIDESAIIHNSSIVSNKCKIGKNVIIGRNTIINDFTVIDDNVTIGDNIVIGCDGFYFKRKKNGELFKFLHAGGVHIHKNVEIMTGSMVQRAHDADFTVVGEGTKISVNVNVGHSAMIGMHTMITGNVQIAGRAKIGSYCWIGTSSTISDSVTISDNSKVRIGSVVVKDIKEKGDVSGNFAYAHSKRIKNFVKEQR